MPNRQLWRLNPLYRKDTRGTHFSEKDFVQCSFSENLPLFFSTKIMKTTVTVDSFSEQI